MTDAEKQLHAQRALMFREWLFLAVEPHLHRIPDLTRIELSATLTFHDGMKMVANTEYDRDDGKVTKQ